MNPKQTIICGQTCFLICNFDERMFLRLAFRQKFTSKHPVSAIMWNTTYKPDSAVKFWNFFIWQYRMQVICLKRPSCDCMHTAKLKWICPISILMPGALFMRYTTCCLVCDLWYVYPTGRNQSASGQVTQLVTPLVHHFLPYFINNFCSSLHYLTAKIGWYTVMSHPHLFSCFIRDILKQSSEVQAWTFGTFNHCFPQFCA